MPVAPEVPKHKIISEKKARDAARLDLILGRRGQGELLLDQFGDVHQLAQLLDHAPLTQLQKNKLRAAFELNFENYGAQPIRSPRDAYDYVRDLSIAPKEIMVVLVLDTRWRIIRREDVYVGSTCTSLIRVGELLRPAVIYNGVAIILAHNHPSGDPSPSPEDLAVTRSVVECGKQMDIEVCDHLIVGAGRFVSLKERGGWAFTS